MPRHLFTFKDSTWCLILSNWTMSSMCKWIPMSSILHTKVMSFDYACITFTNCCSWYINFFTFATVSNTNFFTCFYFIQFIIINSKLMEFSAWFRIVYIELTLVRFWIFAFKYSGCYLYCIIAIWLLSLDSIYYIRICLNNSHRYRFSIFRENPCHAALLSNDTYHLLFPTI